MDDDPITNASACLAVWQDAVGQDGVQYSVISITIAEHQSDPLALGLHSKLHKFT